MGFPLVPPLKKFTIAKLFVCLFCLSGINLYIFIFYVRAYEQNGDQGYVYNVDTILSFQDFLFLKAK